MEPVLKRRFDEARISPLRFGYFLSAMLTLVVTFVITARILEELPYRTLVLGNKSVQAQLT